MRELVPLMDKGDVLAHPFTRHPGGFISEETGEVHPIVWAALERGVTVDVGHGSHFSFDMARRTLQAGIKPYTLGADMHGYNVKVSEVKSADRAANPFAGVAPFNLTNAMTKLLALGMTLPDIVATVTSNPAAMLGLSDRIGSLHPGMEADVSVLDVLDGAFELADNSGARGDDAADDHAGFLPACGRALRCREPARATSCRPRRRRLMPMLDPARHWAALSRAERDAAYDNAAAVPERDALVHRRDAQGERYRATHPAYIDIPYAEGERTKWDLFPARHAEAPCLVFIHGGYWQMNRRENFAGFAEGMAAHGWSVALPGYTLAPAASLTAILAELNQAFDWLAENGAGARHRRQDVSRRLVRRRSYDRRAVWPPAVHRRLGHLRYLRVGPVAGYLSKRGAAADG